MKNNKHSGYVALIGRTNVGKSTFLNRIMSIKISIISDKPQTTRKQILGIKTTPSGQIIFFDSPGIHKPFFKLNEKMMQDVYNSLLDADIILYFIDIEDERKDEFVLSLVENAKKKTFLIINKIDKYSKSIILDRINYYQNIYHWQEIIPISALKGDNIDLLEKLIYKYLPENEFFYSKDEYTMQSEKFFLSELIREKLLQLMRDELPFATTVKIEEINDRKNTIYVRAEIFVESQSQKKIVIGKQGNAIKKIGELARKDMEKYFNNKVYLDLFVKVVPNWRNSPVILSEIFK